MTLKTQGLNTKGNFTLCSQISLFACLNKGRGQLVYATFFCSLVVSGQQRSIYNVSSLFTSTFLHVFFPVALRPD